MNTFNNSHSFLIVLEAGTSGSERQSGSSEGLYSDLQVTAFLLYNMIERRSFDVSLLFIYSFICSTGD
jgi:hypothetical protein